VARAIEVLDQAIKAMQAEEAELLDAQKDALSLPTEEDTSLILRYTAANDRQLHRAIDQLGQLQKRRGESDPPDDLDT
jgi:hypothetical protein